MKRRAFLNLCSGLVSLLGAAGSMQRGQAAVSTAGVNLLSAPLDVNGDWGDSPRAEAALVISQMREACLSGLRLLSEDQPDRLRVDNHASGPPHIWLHAENPMTAWFVVDIQTRAWSQLAYQCGHELGHVMCNSWMWKVQSPPPSRWLEECLVEAFSIRGIARLADAHEHDPPFTGDREYGRSLRNYHRYLIEKYRDAAGPEPIQNIAAWFRASRAPLDEATGLSVGAGPAILQVLEEMEVDKGCVEDLGALNRWPARSGVPLEEYLRLWRASCAQIEAPGRLPSRLQEIFALRGPGDP
jgi:hypothetical protein